MQFRGGSVILLTLLSVNDRCGDESGKHVDDIGSVTHDDNNSLGKPARLIVTAVLAWVNVLTVVVVVLITHLLTV